MQLSAAQVFSTNQTTKQQLMESETANALIDLAKSRHQYIFFVLVINNSKLCVKKPTITMQTNT